MPDAQRQVDGDSGFIGIDTRNNPATLKAGVLQDGRNIRLELATLETRKGIERLISDVDSATIGTVYGSGIYVQSDGTERVVLVVADGLYLFDVVNKTRSNKYSFPAGRTVNTNVKVIQAVNKIYILRGEATRYITGDGTATQRVSTSTAPHNVATVTTASPHGLSVGSEFIIEVNDQYLRGPTSSNNFVVGSVISSTQFTYNISTASNHTGAYVIQVGKPVLVFDGSNVNIVKQGIIDGTIVGGTTPTECDFPPTSTAIYHKNRIYLKYSRDEIAVSDYLPNASGNWLFDLTIQALTVNQGDEQEIVGFHPWTRDEILVFKNNSIYAAKFADSTNTPDVVLANSYVRSLTFDIGCVSQASIANVSGMVFFLSQRGIYRLEPQLDVSLLANTAPMSTQIQKYIDRINANYVSNAVGTVYNGRYYLSVPIDNSSSNNHVLVYNLNNQMWESVDTYPSSIDIKNILMAKSGTTSVLNRMIFSSATHGLYLAEEKNWDEYGTLTSSPYLPVYLPFNFEPLVYTNENIDGYAKSRRYVFNTLQNKRFTTIGTDIDFNGTGVIQTNALTYNPDTTTTVDTATSELQEDYTRIFPVRKVAVGLEVELNVLQGTPKVRNITVEATISGKNTQTKD